MAYKNIEDKRKNAREYYKKNKDKINRVRRENKKRNRLDFFNGKCCSVCHSTKNLELHHRDPSQKETHRIWEWSEERRNSEIEKCDILCRSCHMKHHREMLSNWNAKLNKNDVLEIRRRLKLGESASVLAKEFGVLRPTIYKIKNKKIWKDI